MGIRTTSCCGLRDFSGLQRTPRLTLKTFYQQLQSKTGAFFIFSGTNSSCIESLKYYIEENHLGKVIKTEWVRNPNSGNYLMILVYEPDRTKLKKWYEKDYSVYKRPRVNHNYNRVHHEEPVEIRWWQYDDENDNTRDLFMIPFLAYLVMAVAIWPLSIIIDIIGQIIDLIV